MKLSDFAVAMSLSTISTINEAKQLNMCEGSCMFCKECIKCGAEVAIGEGKTAFNCFGHW